MCVAVAVAAGQSTLARSEAMCVLCLPRLSWQRLATATPRHQLMIAPRGDAAMRRNVGRGARFLPGSNFFGLAARSQKRAGATRASALSTADSS